MIHFLDYNEPITHITFIIIDIHLHNEVVYKTLLKLYKALLDTTMFNMSVYVVLCKKKELDQNKIIRYLLQSSDSN